MNDPRAIPEPPMTPRDWVDFRRGADLFNEGRFWHAHEAWETVWLRKRDLPSQKFFKGLIQLAAAHHQRTQGRYEGMLIHSGRAREKLAPFAPNFLGVPVDPLLSLVEAGRTEALHLGKENLEQFDPALVPAIRLPSPPDESPSAAEKR